MSVAYHRHCQATVLSANGTGNQNGETWNIINAVKSSLTHLPDSWIDYFKSNTKNITEDFVSILKILNDVASYSVRQVKINGSTKSPDANGIVDLGNILTTANISDVVHKSGEETITGAKTFTDTIYSTRTGSLTKPTNVTKFNDIDITKLTSYPAFTWNELRDKNNRVIVAEHYGDNLTNKTCRETHSYGTMNGAITHGRTMFTDRINWNNSNNKFECSLLYGATDDNGGSLIDNKNVTTVGSTNTNNMLATMGWVSNPSTSTAIVHKAGSETISGNKTFSGTSTFNGTTTLKGTVTKLSATPAQSVTGNEVIDAAWVNKKIMDLNLYSPPATLDSIRVYISTTGNDETALAAFKELISSQNVGSDAQKTLASKPFKTIAKAVEALNLVRSSSLGFNFYIFVLPGTYTISLTNTANAIISNGPIALRHPDCNDYSGSKLILRGVKDAALSPIDRNQVIFTFDDVNTARSGSFGTSNSYLQLINANVENICFRQKDITLSSTGEPSNYTSPCTSKDINSGDTYIIVSAKGGNSIINCECFCKPVKCSDNNFRSYIYVSVQSKSSLNMYSTGNCFRQSATSGHRCCFYGLYEYVIINDGTIASSWKTLDFYFKNCNIIYRIGDENEYDTTLSYWINNNGDPKEYQAYDLDDVQYLLYTTNNSRVLLRSNQNEIIPGLYNPLGNTYLRVVQVKNSPDFKPSNNDGFNKHLSDNNSKLISVTDREDYNKLIKFMGYYNKIS